MLYSTYRLHVGGVNEAGVGMPAWEGLSIPMRNAWSAVQVAGSGQQPPPPPQTGQEGQPPPAEQPQTSPPPPASSAVLWTQEDLEQLTVTDLRELCTQAHVTVSSSATKQQLIDALLAHQQSQPSPPQEPTP